MNSNGLTAVTVLGLWSKSKSSLLAVALATSLAGCVSIKQMPSPSEINAWPVDCRNQQFYIRQLENLLDTNRPLWRSEASYDATVSAIKSKIWTIRYTCQPL